jgi:hypothetical protein
MLPDMLEQFSPKDVHLQSVYGRARSFAERT